MVNSVPYLMDDGTHGDPNMDPASMAGLEVLDGHATFRLASKPAASSTMPEVVRRDYGAASGTSIGAKHHKHECFS